jgi:hypothetical protein
MMPVPLKDRPWGWTDESIQVQAPGCRAFRLEVNPQ